MKTHEMTHRGNDAPGHSKGGHNEKDPEIRFLTEMIDHHAMAVEMSEALANEAVRPELKQLGRNIITSQRAEIEQMRRWLRNWHGIEH